MKKAISRVSKTRSGGAGEEGFELTMCVSARMRDRLLILQCVERVMEVATLRLVLWKK